MEDSENPELRCSAPLAGVICDVSDDTLPPPSRRYLEMYEQCGLVPEHLDASLEHQNTAPSTGIHTFSTTGIHGLSTTGIHGFSTTGIHGSIGTAGIHGFPTSISPPSELSEEGSNTPDLPEGSNTPDLPDMASEHHKKMYQESGVVSELLDEAPEHLLKIVYDVDNVLERNTGKENTPTQVKFQPLSITWPGMSDDHFYTIIMIDPDMPSRTTPVDQKTQVLHWLMVNIPGSGVGGRQLAPYIGSGPPPSTGIHRYNFLVFDEGRVAKDYSKIIPMDLVDIGRRVYWNLAEPGKTWTFRGFQDWAKLGEPIAGNFYVAQWDPWVDQLWQTFNQFYEERFKACGLIPELLDQPPKQLMKIVYENDRVLHKNTGVENTPTQVKLQPISITWPDMKEDHFYTIIMIDPDMPSRTTPVNEKTQVLHWLMVNIPGCGVGGRQLAPYIGSGPPPGTGIHRYNFFVFDEGVKPKDYSCVKPMDLVDIGKRVNWCFTEQGKTWTFRGFMAWAKMGLPIAGNFYQAQWDPQVDRLWRTFNQYYE